MSSTKFDIPIEYRDRVAFDKCGDSRSDAEIIATLRTFRPVTSEKNLWAFWHSGVHSMPGWCQRNVCAWVRMHSEQGWTIRVLDNIAGSENHAINYLSALSLPAAFIEGTMDGPYVGPHSADILRGACLYEHGGVFLDVGNLLVRNIERICWSILNDPNTSYEVAVPWVNGTGVANHFVAARKHNPFIHRWHTLFCHLWAGHTNFVGLMKSPLMAIVDDQNTDLERAGKFGFGTVVDPAIVDEYVTQVMCWNRLCILEDAGDGFSGVDYWANNILLWDSLEENWGAEATLGFDGCGQKMFDFLSLPLDDDPSHRDYQSASTLVWRLLSGSCIQKIFRGKGLTAAVELGELWDNDKEGRDAKSGTFAELLRYGCENIRQKRESITYVKAPRPQQTYRKSLLE